MSSFFQLLTFSPTQMYNAMNNVGEEIYFLGPDSTVQLLSDSQLPWGDSMDICPSL